MRKTTKSKNRSTRELGERNLLIRVKIINSFNLAEEVFLKKYFCDRETLFLICLPSFKKLLREKSDIKFISLYLSNLKKFITLLKNINEDSNNNNNNNTIKQTNEEKDKYLKILRYVSEHIIYEKFSSKRIIMRYGDIGDKYFIILHGIVSILIPIKVNMQLTFNEFSRYIARLILYREYELAKITMRENKHIYNIDLPDIKFIIRYINKNIDDDTNEKEDGPLKLNFYYQSRSIKSTKNIHKQKLGNKISKYLITNVDEEENRNLEVQKMIETENASKVERFMTKYLTKEEFLLYEEMKQNDKYIENDNDENAITPEIYINRLKNFKISNNINEHQQRRKSSIHYYHTPLTKSSKKINFIFKEKEENDNYEHLQASHNKNTVYIYEYQEVIQLETGEMFGDTALSNSSSKRSATIISLVDSYFGCLNKEIYNSIKGSNDKNKKNMINYLIHTKIFKSISYKTIEDKYLNFFAFKNSVMDEYIIKREEINSNIIIIKSGSFEISFNGNIKDVFDLINCYRDNFSDLNEKKYEMSDTIFRKIYKLNENRRKIEKLFGEEKDIMNELKLFIINSSSIFGLKESEKLIENNKYLSFYDIKCLSSEGEYVLLDKRIFYRQIYGTDFKVKEETRTYIKEFAEKAINRLIHLLYAKIWNILTKNDMKNFKNIKKLSHVGEESKKNNNLMHEIGLDFNYMNRYNLTDIECIIEKMLNKYNEEAFDNRNLAVYVYNYFENAKITSVQEKNMLRLEDEVCDTKKLNSLFKHLKSKQKKNNFQLLNTKRHNSIVSKPKSKVINNEKVKNPFYNSSTNNIRGNEKIKNRLDKSNYSYIDDKKKNLSQRNVGNRNKRNYFMNNRINYDISKNLSSGLSQGTMMDSFFSDVSVNCNLCNYNNACISKINYNIKKNNSDIDFETITGLKLNLNNIIDQKMSKLFGGNEKYKSLYNRCFSSRHNNNSKISIFDSNKYRKELYEDKRKQYVLKNTRSLFTRNKNFVQYKRRRKREDKNV